MQALLTWSDRGTSSRGAGRRLSSGDKDVGPVMRLVSQPESEGRYDHVVVLTTEEGKRGATELVQELRGYVGGVELRVCEVPDPSDYERVFEVSRDIASSLASDQVDVLLSAGTSQMQTVWVVLVKAGLLAARMLQVIPEEFVPKFHAKAIKVVELEFAGFPEILALREEVDRLRAQVEEGETGLIGTSAAMGRLRQLIIRVAASDVPVLITGETGTGKELVANAVHDRSRRSAARLVPVNCGAFSEGLLESELFGHERGAFTGAHTQRRGLFERAHGGTLFLDEAGELSPKVQATLLRVLQEGTLRRVGGEDEIKVDVRVIAATHRDLRSAVASGSFREDLYYRLRGAELAVPPLRERPEDIPSLVREFLLQLEDPPRVTGQVFHLLRNYAWPGNVRELKAEVVRWSVFGDAVIRARDVSPEVRGQRVPVGEPMAERPTGKTLREEVRQVEEEVIRLALETHSGNLSRTAKALQIDRNTLKAKMKRLGIAGGTPGSDSG